MHGNLSAGPQNELFHNKVASDNQGNLFMLFSFDGLLDVDPSSQVVLGGNESTFNSANLVKYDVNGKFIWSKLIKSDNEINIERVKTDPLGNIYCLLNCAGSQLSFSSVNYKLQGSVSSGIVIKLNQNADVVWIREIGYNNSGLPTLVSDLVVDNQQNVYVAGYYSSGINFYGTSGILQYDSSLVFQ